MNINLKTLGLAVAGGFVGTLLRNWLSINTPGLIALTAVNVVGSALIGWLNADPRFSSETNRAFWGVGVAGGFTTMSGVAIWMAFGARLNVIGLAIGLIMFGIGLLAYWGTHALTSRLTGNDAAVSHDVEEVSE